MKHLMPLLIVGLVCAYLFIGCDQTDPLGATTRASLRTEGTVRVAEAEAHAQIESARYAADAQVATAQTWAGTLPMMLLILVSGALVGIVFYFRGRAYLIQVARTSDRHCPDLPTDYLHRLRTYARQQGYTLEIVNGQYYLVDRQTGRRLRALSKA